MRIVRNPLALTLALVAAFAVAQGCGKSDSKDDNKSGGGNGGGSGEPQDGDAVLKDEYQGVYQLVSQVETPYFDGCEAEAGPVDAMDQLPPFFKLDTVIEFTMDPQSELKTDLWLYECSDAQTCQGQVMNFLFPEKADGAWGGQTSLSISKSPFEPNLCSFGYTERSAKLTGKDILIVTTQYSGDVAPIGGGCMHADGGADLQEYYTAYRGKINCDSVETVKGLKLDVPMPE